MPLQVVGLQVRCAFQWLDPDGSLHSPPGEPSYVIPKPPITSIWGVILHHPSWAVVGDGLILYIYIIYPSVLSHGLFESTALRPLQKPPSAMQVSLQQSSICMARGFAAPWNIWAKIRFCPRIDGILLKKTPDQSGADLWHRFPEILF